MTDDIRSYVPEAADAADEALDKWLREWPFSGKPFGDFIPPGAIQAVEKLIDNMAMNWPWPFNERELDLALSHFPPDLRDECGRKIVSASRIYLAKLWARIRGPRNKANPTDELRNLSRTADALLVAIASLSDEAQLLLASKNRLRNPNSPDMLRVQYTVDAFLHEHRYLRNLPDSSPLDRRGRKVNVVEREFQTVLDHIYEAAFAGARRGFPAFAKAVTEPLERWGHGRIEEKSRQDRRRPADRSTRQRRIKQDKSSI